MISLRQTSKASMLVAASTALADPLEGTEEEMPWESTTQSMAKEEIVSEAAMIDEITLPMLEYRYASFGQPDPFLPTLEAPSPKQKQLAGFEIPVTSPLQVPLGYLRVKGIWMMSSGERRALVTIKQEYFRDFIGRVSAEEEEKALEGYIAKVGDPIGPAGKIVAINKNALVARQYRILDDGTREFADKSIGLRTSIRQDIINSKKSYILKPGGQIKLKAKSESVEFNKQFDNGEAEIDVSSRSELIPNTPATETVDQLQSGLKE